MGKHEIKMHRFICDECNKKVDSEEMPAGWKKVSRPAHYAVAIPFYDYLCPGCVKKLKK